MARASQSRRMQNKSAAAHGRRTNARHRLCSQQLPIGNGWLISLEILAGLRIKPLF